VRRGHAGLAGEVAHLLTRGPDGRAVRFTDVFAELRLRRPGSTAIDVPAVLRALEAGGDAGGALAPLAEGVRGVVTALVALADPRVVVLGGTWGTHPALVDAVSAHPFRWSRDIPVRAARVAVDAPLAGARQRAVDDLRSAILTLHHGPRDDAGKGTAAPR
jgi:predicted NBD/HSP70 family sugar kinase